MKRARTRDETAPHAQDVAGESKSNGSGSGSRSAGASSRGVSALSVYLSGIVAPASAWPVSSPSQSQETNRHNLRGVIVEHGLGVYQHVALFAELREIITMMRVCKALKANMNRVLASPRVKDAWAWRQQEHKLFESWTSAAIKALPVQARLEHLQSAQLQYIPTIERFIRPLEMLIVRDGIVPLDDDEREATVWRNTTVDRLISRFLHALHTVIVVAKRIRDVPDSAPSTVAHAKDEGFNRWVIMKRMSSIERLRCFIWKPTKGYAESPTDVQHEFMLHPNMFLLNTSKYIDWPKSWQPWTYTSAASEYLAGYMDTARFLQADFTDSSRFVKPSWQNLQELQVTQINGRLLSLLAAQQSGFRVLRCDRLPDIAWWPPELWQTMGVDEMTRGFRDFASAYADTLQVLALGTFDADECLSRAEWKMLQWIQTGRPTDTEKHPEFKWIFEMKEQERAEFEARVKSKQLLATCEEMQTFNILREIPKFVHLKQLELNFYVSDVTNPGLLQSEDFYNRRTTPLSDILRFCPYYVYQQTKPHDLLAVMTEIAHKCTKLQLIGIPFPANPTLCKRFFDTVVTSLKHLSTLVRPCCKFEGNAYHDQVSYTWSETIQPLLSKHRFELYEYSSDSDTPLLDLWALRTVCDLSAYFWTRENPPMYTRVPFFRNTGYIAQRELPRHKRTVTFPNVYAVLLPSNPSAGGSDGARYHEGDFATSSNTATWYGPPAPSSNWPRPSSEVYGGMLPEDQEHQRSQSERDQLRDVEDVWQRSDESSVIHAYLNDQGVPHMRLVRPRDSDDRDSNGDDDDDDGGGDGDSDNDSHEDEDADADSTQRFKQASAPTPDSWYIHPSEYDRLLGPGFEVPMGATKDNPVVLQAPSGIYVRAWRNRDGTHPVVRDVSAARVPKRYLSAAQAWNRANESGDGEQDAVAAARQAPDDFDLRQLLETGRAGFVVSPNASRSNPEVVTYPDGCVVWVWFEPRGRLYVKRVFEPPGGCQHPENHTRPFRRRLGDSSQLTTSVLSGPRVERYSSFVHSEHVIDVSKQLDLEYTFQVKRKDWIRNNEPDTWKQIFELYTLNHAEVQAARRRASSGASTSDTKHQDEPTEANLRAIDYVAWITVPRSHLRSTAATAPEVKKGQDPDAEILVCMGMLESRITRFGGLPSGTLFANAFTRAEYRRQGHFTRLLQNLIRWYTTQDLPKPLYLLLEPSNTCARHAYEKAGFKQTDVMKKPPPGMVGATPDKPVAIMTWSAPTSQDKAKSKDKDTSEAKQQLGGSVQASERSRGVRYDPDRDEHESFQGATHLAFVLDEDNPKTQGYIVGTPIEIQQWISENRKIPHMRALFNQVNIDAEMGTVSLKPGLLAETFLRKVLMLTQVRIHPFFVEIAASAPTVGFVRGTTPAAFQQFLRGFEQSGQIQEHARAGQNGSWPFEYVYDSKSQMWMLIRNVPDIPLWLSLNTLGIPLRFIPLRPQRVPAPPAQTTEQD